MSQGRPARMLTIAATAVLFILSTVAAAAHAQGYQTRWTPARLAKEEARKALYGILYYFPPEKAEKLHPVFETKEMWEQSTKSPFVKVAGERDKKLREEYQVDPRYHILLVTDWFGNPLGKPHVARAPEQKLPAKKILRSIKGCERFVEGLEREVKKRLKKAEKRFKGKHWRAAIKDYLWLTSVRGVPEREQARSRLEEIEEVGDRRLTKARTLAAQSKDDALKELRKIAKEFRGTAVEGKAARAIAELKAKASSLHPSCGAADAMS
ncbi:MAG: hypothetical protein ACE5GW_06215 [Planctomycetota bacterium]